MVQTAVCLLLLLLYFDVCFLSFRLPFHLGALTPTACEARVFRRKVGEMRGPAVSVFPSPPLRKQAWPAHLLRSAFASAHFFPFVGAGKFALLTPLCFVLAFPFCCRDVLYLIVLSGVR